MVVEPESLCWLAGRMVQARDGVTWAEEFARYPALKAVVRDDGSGLGKGLKLERARRRAAGQSDIDDTLDIFHTLREGGRALRATWGRATRALEAAVLSASLDLEGLRRQPWRLSATTPGSAATRAWMLARTVQLAKADPAGIAQAQRIGQVLRGVWRASSLVECVNSVARMQQAR